MQPDVNSKLINGYYETSKGFGYFNDGKTTCKIGSTVLNKFSNVVLAGNSKSLAINEQSTFLFNNSVLKVLVRITKLESL